MAQQIVDIGITGNDGTGDSIREAFSKLNGNCTELYSLFAQQQGNINTIQVDSTYLKMFTPQWQDSPFFVASGQSEATTIVNFNASKINMSGSIESDQFADLAEYYEGDALYEVGTVLAFGGDKEVTISTKHMDTRVAGVVSEKAAFKMYTDCAGLANCIALKGRVPVKVLGRVKKGDILVSAARAGFAIVNNDPKVGTIIGKSLNDKTTDGDGIVEASVGF